MDAKMYFDEEREEDKYVVEYDYRNNEDENDYAEHALDFCECFKTESEALEFIEKLN